MAGAAKVEIRGEYFTVRQLIEELRKLPKEMLDAPVGTSKFNHASKAWELDGVSEVVESKGKILSSGHLGEADENTLASDLVKVVVLY